MQIKLSILIPAIPSRWEKFQKIFDKLNNQATDEVEVLGFIDNKKRSIGAKRDGLKVLVNGEYMCYVDDDDDIHRYYIKEILKAIEEKPDVIVFYQYANIDGKECIVQFDIDNNNEPFVPNTFVKRKPFCCCVFKSSLAKKYNFPYTMYGEDWAWAVKVLKDVKTQVKIRKILHYYYFDSKVTEAK